MSLRQKVSQGFVCALMVVLPSLSCSASFDDALSAAQQVQHSIESKDVVGLISYIPEGMCFGDGCYSRDEVVGLLENEQSWLYRGLFDGKDSLRAHLLGADQVKISIHEESGFFIVMYHSSATERPVPPGVALICRDGKWFITDLYEF